MDTLPGFMEEKRKQLQAGKDPNTSVVPKHKSAAEPSLPQSLRTALSLAPKDLLEGWTVYNYQVPVPQGDCSVHLLCHEDTCVSAFVMDGGLGSKAGACLDRALAKIRTDHGLTGQWLRGWVCTHWDAEWVLSIPENGAKADRPATTKDSWKLSSSATWQAFTAARISR
jgi:hypothetical protein